MKWEPGKCHSVTQITIVMSNDTFICMMYHGEARRLHKGVITYTDGFLRGFLMLHVVQKYLDLEFKKYPI